MSVEPIKPFSFEEIAALAKQINENPLSETTTGETEDLRQKLRLAEGIIKRYTEECSRKDELIRISELRIQEQRHSTERERTISDFLVEKNDLLISRQEAQVRDWQSKYHSMKIEKERVENELEKINRPQKIIGTRGEDEHCDCECEIL